MPLKKGGIRQIKNLHNIELDEDLHGLSRVALV